MQACVKRFSRWLVLPLICLFLLVSLTGCGDRRSWVVSTIQKQYYYDLSEEEIGTAYDNGTINDLLDRYSAFYTAEEYRTMTQTNNTGNRVGLGISYSFRTGYGIVLTTVIGNSPAYRAGLRKGDVLTSGSVNGGNTVTFTSENDLSALITAVAEGDVVRLTGEEKEYVVTAASYTSRYASMVTTNFVYSFNDADELQMTAFNTAYLPEGTAVITLQQFFGTVADDTGKLIQAFNRAGCKTLILDLRQNGGGYVSDMAKIGGCLAANYTDDRTAMVAQYKSGVKKITSLSYPKDDAWRLNKRVDVYVLADTSTASASEALIGVLYSAGMIEYGDIFLADFDDAYVDWYASRVGIAKNCRSYGKGIMQDSFVNSDTGEALKLTVAKITWPNGTCIHDTGVTAEAGCRTVKAGWCAEAGDPFLQTVVKTISA